MEQFYVLFVSIVEGAEVVRLSAKMRAAGLPKVKEEIVVDFNDPATEFTGGKGGKKEIAGKVFRASVTEVIPAKDKEGLPTVICRVSSDGSIESQY